MIAASARLDISGPTKPYRFGSNKAWLLKVIDDDKHRMRSSLTSQDLLDLRAWIDLNGPYFDRCFSKRDSRNRYGAANRFGPQEGAFRKYVRSVHRKRCAGCHAVDATARLDWIKLEDPERSLFLSAPLAVAAGGAQGCPDPVYADTSDPDYQEQLRRLWPLVIHAWRNPRHDLRSVVEARGIPETVRRAMTASEKSESPEAGSRP